MKGLFDIGKKVIVVTGATGVLAGATAIRSLQFLTFYPDRSYYFFLLKWQPLYKYHSLTYCV